MRKVGSVRAGVGTRAALAVPIVAVLLLGATACGTDTESDASAQPLNQEQLSKAALTQGDVSGYTVRDVSPDQDSASAGTSKEECRPIVDVLAPQTVAYEGRLVRRNIVKAPSGTERAEASYQLALFSAKSDSAADKALQDLKKAVSACEDGFEAKLSAETYKVRQVTLNKSSFGNDSVDFSLEYQMGRKKRFVMTSSGTSLIVFAASNQFDNAFVPVPDDLVDEQESKLEEEQS